MNDPTVDWTVRHGHAIALSAVLHDATERIVSQGLLQAVTDAAVLHASTDRVSETRICPTTSIIYSGLSEVVIIMHAAMCMNIFHTRAFRSRSRPIHDMKRPVL